MFFLRTILILIVVAAICFAGSYFTPLAVPAYDPATVYLSPFAAIPVILLIACLLGYKKESLLVLLLALIGGGTAGAMYMDTIKPEYNSMSANYYLVHNEPAKADAIFQKMAAEKLQEGKSDQKDFEAAKEALIGNMYLDMLLLKDDQNQPINKPYACVFIKPGTQHVNKALNLYIQAGKAEKTNFLLKLLDNFEAATPLKEKCN